MNLKLQIDSIFDSLRKTRPHFLFCLLPSLLVNEDVNTPTSTADVSLMRSQLKSYQLLAAARIYRQGYPEHVNYEEFGRRFAMFLPAAAQHQLNQSLSISSNGHQALEILGKQSNSSQGNDTHKQTCVQILKAIELDGSLWKLGSTQVFFKAGVLARLDEQRDERLESLIIRVQAIARRYLAEKSFDKKKVFDFYFF